MMLVSRILNVTSLPAPRLMYVNCLYSFQATYLRGNCLYRYQAVSYCHVVTTCSFIPTGSIHVAVDDNAEVYYGTDYGIVGVADIQQLATSSQVISLLLLQDYALI